MENSLQKGYKSELLVVIYHKFMSAIIFLSWRTKLYPVEFKQSDMIETDTFSRESAIKLKGIAIIMMLIHHCFRTADRFVGYSVLLFPLKEHELINMAEACKICVSIFAFITGYGLFLKFKKHHGTAQSWVVIV